MKTALKGRTGTVGWRIKACRAECKVGEKGNVMPSPWGGVEHRRVNIWQIRGRYKERERV